MQVFNPNDKSPADVNLSGNPFDISGFIKTRQENLYSAEQNLQNQLQNTRNAVEGFGTLSPLQAQGQSTLANLRNIRGEEASAINKDINSLNTQQVQDLETARAREEQLSREGFSNTGTASKLGQEAVERNIQRNIENLAISTRQRDLGAFDERIQEFSGLLKESIDQDFEKQKMRIDIEKEILSNAQKGADASQKALIDSEMKQLDINLSQAKDLAETRIDLAKTVLENGASGVVANQIAKAGTVEEAFKIAGESGRMRDPLKALQMAQITQNMEKVRREIALSSVGRLSTKTIQNAQKTKQVQQAESAILLNKTMEEFLKVRDSLESGSIKRAKLKALRNDIIALESAAKGLGAPTDDERAQIEKDYPISLGFGGKDRVRQKLEVARSIADANIEASESAFPGISEQYTPFLQYKEDTTTKDDFLTKAISNQGFDFID